MNVLYLSTLDLFFSLGMCRKSAPWSFTVKEPSSLAVKVHSRTLSTFTFSFVEYAY